ncbi:Copper/zinc superoxide dismutase (SODC) [seawater metagenome]|uniref:Copper/zinc superoxide dismutase (SODC) n=1 Tax=seawater metagenome TaxID=1561972 RepID=A0A5E8CGV5_9ZZZZ
MKILTINSSANSDFLSEIFNLTQEYNSHKIPYMAFSTSSYFKNEFIFIDFQENADFITKFLVTKPDLVVIIEKEGFKNTINIESINFLKNCKFDNVKYISYEKKNPIFNLLVELDSISFNNNSVLFHKANTTLYLLKTCSPYELQNALITINNCKVGASIEELDYQGMAYKGDIIHGLLETVKPIYITKKLIYELINKKGEILGHGIIIVDDLFNNPNLLIFPVVAMCKIKVQGKNCKGEIDSTKNKCKGSVVFIQNNEKDVVIRYCITGISPGKHGMHIHEKADFSKGCESAGAHFNPFNKKHGGAVSIERHVGDLGNIIANQDGKSKGVLKLHNSGIMLYGDPKLSIINRSVIIHQGEDDLGKTKHHLSATTGNSGARIGCGKINLLFK